MQVTEPIELLAGKTILISHKGKSGDSPELPQCCSHISVSETLLSSVVIICRPAACSPLRQEHWPQSSQSSSDMIMELQPPPQ